MRDKTAINRKKKILAKKLKKKNVSKSICIHATVTNDVQLSCGLHSSICLHLTTEILVNNVFAIFSHDIFNHEA